ncbi:PucR family transcriptional regulator [Brevibacterium sp. UBA7493]|uniref:PucR family transcriptional regulator n=1 Tax=Brevibacterium sp. UBA7493 TaxID=1946121 RepID=UPI0025805C58|nr:helix-turn-helix domain-containing protein [Brevibacterium sp. UBA7493]
MFDEDPVLVVAQRLATLIQRSVAIDDADLNYIGHSDHSFGDEDLIRLRSLAERRLHEPVRDYVKSLDMENWFGPVRVPALNEYGFDNDRVAFPIRNRGRLLGVLWIIADDEMSRADQADCVAATQELGSMLEGRTVQRTPSKSEIERWVRQLLDESSAPRLDGARTLGEFNILPADGLVDTSVIRLFGGDAGPTMGDFKRLSEAWHRSFRTDRKRVGIAFSPVEFVGISERFSSGDVVDARRVEAGVVRQLRTMGVKLKQRIHVGMGDPTKLADVFVSVEQARVAASVAEAGRLPAVRWCDRPLECYLMADGKSGVSSRLLPVALGALEAKTDRETLETVLVYLDCAGSAASTADRLHLHRATVYYRLKRFEEQSGIDLANGQDRLLLHVWLYRRKLGLA